MKVMILMILIINYRLVCLKNVFFVVLFELTNIDHSMFVFNNICLLGRLGAGQEEAGPVELRSIGCVGIGFEEGQ